MKRITGEQITHTNEHSTCDGARGSNYDNPMDAADRIAELEETCLNHAQIESSLSERIEELEAMLRDERRLRRIYQLEAQQGRIEALGGDDE